MSKYQNKGGQPREKCMIAAYALTKNYGATQEAVAGALGCTQGTIANWVKEISYKNEISGLKKELSAANNYIGKLANELNLIEYNPDEDDE